MTDKPKSAPSPRRLRHFWLYASGLGLGLLCVGLLLWSFFQGKAVFTAPKKDAEASPVQAPTAPGTPAGSLTPAEIPPGSAPALKSQLEQVLAGIREANRKRDLSKLLSYYSPNFPQLTQRAQSISKTWKIYNYPKMEFEVQEVKLLGENAAQARVTWTVEAQNISTMKLKSLSKTYLIIFTRESGQWRISALDKTE